MCHSHLPTELLSDAENTGPCGPSFEHKGLEGSQFTQSSFAAIIQGSSAPGAVTTQLLLSAVLSPAPPPSFSGAGDEGLNGRQLVLLFSFLIQSGAWGRNGLALLLSFRVPV